MSQNTLKNTDGNIFFVRHTSPFFIFDLQCRLRVFFKSLRVEALCAAPVRLPRCVAGTKWGLHLCVADRETVANISNGTLCLKPGAVFGHARDDRCAIGLSG